MSKRFETFSYIVILTFLTIFLNVDKSIGCEAEDLSQRHPIAKQVLKLEKDDTAYCAEHERDADISVKRDHYNSFLKDLGEDDILARINTHRTLLENAERHYNSKWNIDALLYYIDWTYNHLRISKASRAIGYVGEALESGLIIVAAVKFECNVTWALSLSVACIKAAKFGCFYIANQSEQAYLQRRKLLDQMMENLRWEYAAILTEAKNRGIRIDQAQDHDVETGGEKRDIIVNIHKDDESRSEGAMSEKLHTNKRKDESI